MHLSCVIKWGDTRCDYTRKKSETYETWKMKNEMTEEKRTEKMYMRDAYGRNKHVSALKIDDTHIYRNKLIRTHGKFEWCKILIGANPMCLMAHHQHSNIIYCLAMFYHRRRSCFELIACLTVEKNVNKRLTESSIRSLSHIKPCVLWCVLLRLFFICFKFITSTSHCHRCWILIYVHTHNTLHALCSVIIAVACKCVCENENIFASRMEHIPKQAHPNTSRLIGNLSEEKMRSKTEPVEIWIQSIWHKQLPMIKIEANITNQPR